MTFQHKKKKNSETVTCSKYKAEERFYPIDLESEVTERLRIMCPCSLFFSTGQTIQHWKRDPKSIQTWMKKSIVSI